MRTLRPLATLLLLLAAARPAAAQIYFDTPQLEGPRFGATMLTGDFADRAAEELGIVPVISQFGWQFETELVRSRTTGITAITEWVPLVGGLEQGVFLPSLSWLVGLRTRSGAEFAVGPNVSLAGAALAFAGGASIDLGDIAIPFNLAVVPSREGMRLSLLSGFYVRR